VRGVEGYARDGGAERPRLWRAQGRACGRILGEGAKRGGRLFAGIQLTLRLRTLSFQQQIVFRRRRRGSFSGIRLEQNVRGLPGGEPRPLRWPIVKCERVVADRSRRRFVDDFTLSVLQGDSALLVNTPG